MPVSQEFLTSGSPGTLHTQIMEIKFTDQFINYYQKQFNFSQSHVRDSMLDKDEVQKIDLQGKEIFLFKKRIQTPDKLFYWLIEAHYNNNVYSVSAAYRIYAGLIPKIDESPPFEILKNFVDSFGLTLNIGDQARKFFIKEEVLIKNYVPNNEIIKILSDGCANYVNSFWLRIKDVSQHGTIVEIALAYCIDGNKYLGYLISQK